VNPQFVHDLLDAICEFNLAQIEKALDMISTRFFLEMTGGNNARLSWATTFGRSSFSRG
jgi:hypothetical protein